MIDPTRRQVEELAALGAENPGPIVMLNLNRYRDRAAYERYGRAALPVLERVGGRVLWRADARQTVIGEETDRFDEVIAVWYPSVAAFTSFAGDPEILAAFEHRRAGLEQARLVCCEPGDGPMTGK